MLHGAFGIEGAGGVGRGWKEEGVAELKNLVVVGILEVGEHVGVTFFYAGDAHVRVSHHLGRTEGRAVRDWR